MKNSKCKICGCTDNHACIGGCFWVDSNHTICSRCAIDKPLLFEDVIKGIGVFVIDQRVSANSLELKIKKEFIYFEDPVSYWINVLDFMNTYKFVFNNFNERYILRS